MTLVFTNGCFDGIHPDHIRLLEFAAKQGDRLIVGVNSDDSVRRLKGQGRPYMIASDRVLILEAIRWVSEVIVFPEDTPTRLIEEVRPDVLVKGPEAQQARVPGADLVESWGGEVLFRPGPITHSTTELVERIRNGESACHRR